jgi:hypothetical protein
MKKMRSVILTALASLIAMLACNMPLIQEPAPPPSIDTIPSEPDSAEIEPQAQLPPPSETPTQTTTPTITETPTITPTFTPEIPKARVTRNTNCRTGPGTEYDIVYILLVGEEAEIIARSSIQNYVIVEVPDGSGRTCWLWMQYGEMSGSTEGLPERTPPPTPTPALSFSFNFDSMGTCLTSENVFIKVTNTGAVNLESYSISAENLDTSETDSHQGNDFGQGPFCVTISEPTIAPGDSAYTAAGFTPPIAGDTIHVTIKVCSQNGLSGQCSTKSDTFSIPFPSDENVKEDFEPVDSAEILTKVSELPITSWNYKDSEREGRHIGPMAQDFNERFGVGEYEGYISAVDSSGVALAAIQALSDITDQQERRIALLEEQNELLKLQNESLNNKLVALEAQYPSLTWFAHALIVAVLVLAGFWYGKRVNQRISTGGEPPG